MRNLLLAGAAAAAIVAIGPAIAQPAPPTPPGVAQGSAPVPPVAPGQRVQMQFHYLPMKAETRDEMVAHVRDMFARLDANKDGYITRQEADAAHHQAMGGEMREKFAKRFADGDFPHPDRAAMFDKLDTNKDGSITRQEFMAAQPHFNEGRAIVMRDGPPEGGGGPGEPRVKIMRMHSMDMHGRMLKTADANHDGKVSLLEMTNAAVQHFDAADANHDGTLTRKERMQMHQRMKAEHAKPA